MDNKPLKRFGRISEYFRKVEGIRVHPCVSGKPMENYVGTVLLSSKRDQIILIGVDWGMNGPDEDEYPKKLWRIWDNLVSAEDRGR